MQQAHATGNIESDAACGDDAAGVRVECRDAADGEAVAPVRVRHRVNRPDEARQHRDVAQLLVDLVVHLQDLLTVAVQHSGHGHWRLHRDTPREFTVLPESVQIHRLYVHYALSMPRSGTVTVD